LNSCIWEAYLLMLWYTSIFYSKLLKIVQKLTTTWLTQGDFQTPPSSQVFPWQSLIHQSWCVIRWKNMKLAIIPISMFLPPFIDGLVIDNILPHLPMTLSMLWHFHQVSKMWLRVVGEMGLGTHWRIFELIIDHTFTPWKKPTMQGNLFEPTLSLKYIACKWCKHHYIWYWH
jgi:hypothetical protein